MPPGPDRAAGLRGPAGVPAAAQVFVDDLELLVLRAEDAHHLVRALRLRAGETVIAADGHGRWRACRFTGAATRATGAAGEPTPGLLQADGPVETEEVPQSPVTVGFVPVKGERPEWVVQKLTELGVDRIAVLRSARSVVRWEGARAEHSLERLRRVAQEAAAQSRRPRLPELSGVWSLAELAGSVGPGSLGLADPGGDPPDGTVLAVAVGPEGGWEDDERRTPSCRRIGLGPAVLRAETAAVAAAGLLCALRDGTVRPR